MFNTEPFEKLGTFIKKGHVTPSKTLRRRCRRCEVQFEKIGSTPGEFANNILKNETLFESFVKVFRQMFSPHQKFDGAEMTSVTWSVKNAIRRVSAGEASAHDYNLCVAFAEALRAILETEQAAAA